METLPFATQPVPYSIWGCSDGVRHVNVENKSNFRTQTPARPVSTPKKAPCDSSDSYAKKNLEYMPAVLLNTLKKDKKPFTYTPGRIDLSEVLNDKLQKRMERRQKRADERSLPMSPVPDTPTFESQKQVLVMPTYNSPLNMYSMENALEVLEVQAELTVSENSPMSPTRSQSMTLPRNYKYEPMDFEPRNVTQSKAFKVLQIITDTEEEAEQNGTAHRASIHHDEMRFTGIRPSEEIPSKFFHNLQKMTANGGEEPISVTHQTGITNNVGHYHDEMRFSGTLPNNVIPSKLFHNLQRITGTEDEELHNDTAKSYAGPVNASNTGSWEVRFRPKDDMIKQATIKSSANPNQQVRKEQSYSSIPFLQRPAAFLPAKQTATAKNASCCSRFNSMNIHQSCRQPVGRTNY